MLDKNNKLSVLIGFIFIFGFIYLLWVLISNFINILTELDPKLSASIIGAMATILIGTGAIILNHRNTKLREIEEAHRGKKVEIYEKFLHMVASIQGGANDNLSVEAPSERDLADYLFKFKHEIMLWGSPKVIKAQLNFEKEAQSGTKEVLNAMNNIYLAIREDIGLSNSGLKNYELIKMYLSNPKELDDLLK